MDDLQLKSTNELLNEIFSRFDHAVFCGVKLSIKKDRDLYEKHYQGNYPTCMGLCDIIKTHIITDFNIDDGE